MNLKKIQTFVLVMQKKSFRAAGEVLGLTQPAVSSQIKALENEFGIRLLERHTTRVEPTPAGRYVYELGLQLLEKWQELEEGVQHFHDTLSGSIRIGASTIPGTYLLPQWIGGFHQRFPQINIVNKISDSAEIQKLLLDKKVDVAITGSVADSNLVVSEPVATDSLVLISPKDHPLLHSTLQVNPCDLVAYPFVFREVGSGTRSRMEAEMIKCGVDLEDIQVVAEFGSTEAILAAVEAGLGISFVSTWAALLAEKAGRIQLVPTTETFHQTYYLSYLKGHENVPRIKEFIEHIL